MNFTGRAKEAEALVRRAKVLHPYHPAYYDLYLGHALWLQNRADEAIVALEEAASSGTNLSPVHRLLAIAYSETGRPLEAKREIAKVLSISPKATLDGWLDRLPYRKTALVQRYLTGLAAAGFPR